MSKSTYFALVVLFTAAGLSAQDSADYFGKRPFTYSDATYDSHIRSVLLHPFSDPTGFPLLQLNDPQARLLLSFDLLGGEDKDYYYTVIHCTHDWQPSPLLQSEYIDGFYDEQIFQYSPSRNTLQSYIHYEQFIPSASLRITKTGNYLVKVFPEGDPEHPVLSKRFLVIAGRLWCFAGVNQSSEVDSRWEKQELDFDLDYSSLPVVNPTSELKIVILKNRNWNRSTAAPAPFSHFDKKLSFRLNEALRFPGGKEFRYFNCNNIHSKSEWVEEIMTDSSASYFRLLPMKPLNKTHYLEYTDLNGGYMPDLAFSKQPEKEADYVFVEITLQTPPFPEKGNMYIYGQLTNWECQPEYRLKYDESAGAYKTRIYIKQGYYNFRFAFLYPGTEIPDEEKVDGTSYETENEYIILVYRSSPGSNFDSLEGFRLIRSYY
ncbi:MAG: DUF5103 domain-containing protein [Bacteroidia bacterium]|nr:DUF5103 domain-containing protein [Bacteroidia bacterium]